MINVKDLKKDDIVRVTATRQPVYSSSGAGTGKEVTRDVIVVYPIVQGEHRKWAVVRQKGARGAKGSFQLTDNRMSSGKAIYTVDDIKMVKKARQASGDTTMNDVQAARELVAAARELTAADQKRYSHDGLHFGIFSYNNRDIDRTELLAKRMGGKVVDRGVEIDSDGDPMDFTTVAFRDKEAAQAFHAAVDWKRFTLHYKDKPFFPRTKYKTYEDWNSVIAARELTAASNFSYFIVNYTYDGGRTWITIFFAEKSSIDKWDDDNPKVNIEKISKERATGYITKSMSDPYTDVGDDFKKLGDVNDRRGSYQTTAYAPRKSFARAKKDFEQTKRENAEAQNDYYKRPWV